MDSHPPFLWRVASRASLALLATAVPMALFLVSASASSHTTQSAPPGGARALFTLTVAVSPIEGGTTSPPVGIYTYDYGTVVIVTATPAGGYVFDRWSGPCIGTDACQVTMDANKMVTANFTSASGILGDVNGDDAVNSTDALIVLSADADLNTSQFCPMNCGDVNADGQINSTDALIILSYDADMTVPFALGQPGCPASATPPPGCTP
jgi:hypothetical protein